MRKPLTVLALVGVLTALGTAPALAGPELPNVPKDCNEWNALLHIENIRDCNPNG